MVIVGIIVLFIFLLIIGGVLTFWLMSRKKGKKFCFLLYAKNGSQITKKYAIVKTDPSNKNNKRFFFLDSDQNLDIVPPSVYIDGIPHREIIMTKLSEFKYLGDTIIDDTLSIKKAILPEEKALALFRYKENTKRYDNPMSKTSAAILIGGFILIFLLLMGIIYATISFVKASGDMVEMAKQNNEVTTSNSQVVGSLTEITQQMVMISAQLGSNLNITRRIS